MSLDFCLTETKEVSIFDANITHNLTPMWKKAGVYDALYMSEGLIAKGIIEVLEKGIYDMEDKPEEYIKLNAINGWGTYRHALPFLKEILKACKENPDAKIQISK